MVEIREVLKTCEVILHGGDINSQKILDELKEIAPVYVVRGNNDKEWAANLDKELTITDNHKLILLLIAAALFLCNSYFCPHLFHHLILRAVIPKISDSTHVNRIDAAGHIDNRNTLAFSDKQRYLI